jgi:cell wall-associated NlpC family hydrolase
MRRRTQPVRLVAGALVVLSALQVATIASRMRDADAAPGRPGAGVQAAPVRPAGALQARLALAEGLAAGERRLDPATRAVLLPGGIPVQAPSPGARQAVRAALQAVGVPYVWGGMSPSGFDCSGLTMWAWRHAGVALPHSSAAQYGSLPHVSRGALRPGDLVFFYSPISHVEMYLGGGMMVGALTSGGSVGVRPVFWDVYAGAARPS